MFSVETLSLVEANRRSHSSIASHLSSSAERFHRSQWVHRTHNRPSFESNASRRPTGKFSITSFVPSGRLQKRQVEYNEG